MLIYLLSVCLSHFDVSEALRKLNVSEEQCLLKSQLLGYTGAASFPLSPCSCDGYTHHASN